jgi:hypothetical protein
VETQRAFGSEIFLQRYSERPADSEESSHGDRASVPQTVILVATGEAVAAGSSE